MHGLGLDVDAELAVQLLADDLQVGVAHAGEHGLVRLVVAADREGDVLLLQAVQGGHELVLVAFGLRVHGDRQQRGRAGRGPSATTGWFFGARVSPVRTPVSFGTATMSPAWRRRGGLGLLAAHQLQGVQLLLGVGAAVDEGDVGAEGAREHLHERDPADEGVGDRLEDAGEGRSVGVAGELDRVVAGAHRERCRGRAGSARSRR